MTDDIRKYITLIESAKPSEKLHTEKLPYAKDALAPVMSQETINYHYEKLAKGYAQRYNNGEGDAAFNSAGSYLHNLFFPQFRSPKSNNKPIGAALELINKKYKTFESFQEDIKSTAMKIQGSGWVYMNKLGAIETIENHKIKKDIVLLIDWWEHAWALDYQSDKEAYLKNIWKIINWDVINSRL